MNVSINTSVDNVETVTNVSALDRRLSLADAAKLHPGLTANVIREAIHAGKLPATKVGARFFVSEPEVLSFLVSEIV